MCSPESSEVFFPGAWIDNKCTIRCHLHPHKKIAGCCLNGPTCLFLHPECAAALIAKLSAINRDAAHPPRPRLTFDSTLGYPGEGPIRVATYNINGTKGGRLAAVLSQARKAGVDILLLQELHAYEDGSHRRSHRTATLLGWHWFASPGELADPASGVAIAIRDACADTTMPPTISTTNFRGLGGDIAQQPLACRTTESTRAGGREGGRNEEEEQTAWRNGQVAQRQAETCRGAWGRE